LGIQLVFGAALGAAASLHFSGGRGCQLQRRCFRPTTCASSAGLVASRPITEPPRIASFSEAINGMCHGLDPHSAFLDQEAYRDPWSARRVMAWARVSAEDGFVKVVAPIEDTPASAPESRW
jgi:carboxyl-terminal processing protease